jgi:hypothetical protein
MDALHSSNRKGERIKEVKVKIKEKKEKGDFARFRN